MTVFFKISVHILQAYIAHIYAYIAYIAQNFLLLKDG